MKSKLTTFSQRYLEALDKHLKSASTSRPEPARQLGLSAVKLHLETLDLARIHQETLILLILPHHSVRVSKGIIRSASVFFAEALTPIEETHYGALEANVKLRLLIESLKERTRELAASNKELKSEMAQRKKMENSLRINEQTSSKLLIKSRQMQEELRRLSRRLLFAHEDERKRISRELHDVIAQNLTGLNLQLAVLKSQYSVNTKDFQKKIEMTQQLIEQSVEVVHRFARDLRPSVLDDLGLIPALRSYIKGFTKQTGIRVIFRELPHLDELSNAECTVLYRVAQESLSNIARHAEASRAKVTLSKQNGGVRMEIHDNGKGFQVKRDGASLKSAHLGLLGMRERVEMVGGIFCVKSTLGKETTIRAEIPHETLRQPAPSLKSLESA